MSNSKVDRYSGAIELQTDNAHGIYDDLKCKTGLIWATDGITEVPDGMDDATIGEQPIPHNHPNTRAETTTRPFATRFGGSELLGDFSIGSKDLVSIGTYAPTSGQVLNPIQDIDQSPDFTYPLYGENVLDWRTRTRTHNNVPPSLNMYIRCCTGLGRELDYGTSSPRSRQSEKAWSAAEAQYQSFLVPDLDTYTKDDLTLHDCLLRMTLDENAEGNVRLMRQTIQMLMDIFVERTCILLQRKVWDSTHNRTLVFSIWDILRDKLDEVLVRDAEFMAWFYEMDRRMDEAVSKLSKAK